MDLQHEHEARGVGCLVDAILLGRVAGPCVIHASPVGNAELGHYPFFDIGDGVGDGAALLAGRVVTISLMSSWWK